MGYYSTPKMTTLKFQSPIYFVDLGLQFLVMTPARAGEIKLKAMINQFRTTALKHHGDHISSEARPPVPRPRPSAALAETEEARPARRMSACATGGKERGPWAFSPEHLTPPPAHQAPTAATETAGPGHGPLCEASEHRQAEAAYRRATASLLPLRLPKCVSKARFTNPSAEPTFRYTTSDTEEGQEA
ncbi:hypothetical protein NDU88_005132 [Pleurodeles waltl]|uniref:Uncharacterized protein n=1 Tax=Pleurodeles waltl TaxID=8319 RepID=A0AAV7QE49_PLEWA|nr:hypothetical protein NDU88_005132 [Pleurodeles waltl]